MNDADLRPSPDALAVLTTAGWSPERSADVSEWLANLVRDGTAVFPQAETILRQFGGLHVDHAGFGGPSAQDFDVNPAHWYGMRDEVEEIERVLDTRVCPLGETSGAAMLALLEDGRVIAERDGDVVLLGQNWSAALDRLLLGRGDYVTLAENWEPTTGAPKTEREP